MEIENLKNKAGFTLLEALLAIAVLGLLATFTIFRFIGAQAGGRDTKRLSDLKQYQTAIETYATSHNDSYPPDQSSSPPSNPLYLCGSGRPLGNIPCVDDPKAPAQHYRYSVNSARTQYALWAQLEKPATTTWYVFCSDGRSGQATSSTPGFPPSNGNCPSL